jgi:hypothetical protein
LKDRCSEEGIAVRIEAMTTEWNARSQSERGQSLSPDELARARAIANQHLRDHRTYFDDFRRTFFLIDLYPENDGRFRITFEELQNQDDRGLGLAPQSPIYSSL